ncbi:hypothetical protein N7G274_005712 [Stereocaulon virgatum]|uniref:Uncharacterized protein n=1 Tax=Stereocaulon virgatum TaxID=373712 RepID=A0ABR4A684_9LECA
MHLSFQDVSGPKSRPVPLLAILGLHCSVNMLDTGVTPNGVSSTRASLLHSHSRPTKRSRNLEPTRDMAETMVMPSGAAAISNNWSPEEATRKKSLALRSTIPSENIIQGHWSLPPLQPISFRICIL